MSDSNKPDKKQKKEEILGQMDEGYITLPFNQGEFKEFIKGLLGNPQSINKTIDGIFEINFDELRNVNHLIIQRITQQNDGSLAKFSARIVFSDDSSVEFNTIDELLTYNEIRPIFSIAVHMSWDFIVTFPDKKVPEKQKIFISFVSSGRFLSDYDKSFIVFSPKSFMEKGFVNFRIEHTARSWGADIEALLTNHITSLMQSESKLKTFVRKHNGKISFFVAALLFISCLIFGFISASNFSTNRINEVKEQIASLKSVSVETLNQKIDYLTNFVAGGAWSRYYFSLVVFIILSLIISIAIAIWIEESAETNEPSFILLTKESKKHKERVLKKLDKKWISFISAIITALITGVISNYLFSILF